MELINRRIISHPLNWAIIMLMLIIVGMFGHLLLTLLGQEPARGETSEPQGYTVEQVASDGTIGYMGSL